MLDERALQEILFDAQTSQQSLVKVTASGKKVSYGQAGKAKGGGPRVKPGTSKGDAYCARSAGQMKSHSKAAKDPNSPLRFPQTLEVFWH